MKKQKTPKLPSKLLVKFAYTFYAKRFLKTKISLTDDGVLKSLEPPFIVVANHCSFADVVAIFSLLYPKAANYVASKTQFSKYGNILTHLGVVAKKQFSVDTSLVRDIKYLLHNKGSSVVIFPEAKMSVDGTPSIIQPNTAKLLKMMKVPLVTVRLSGTYLFRPKWSKVSRFVPVVAETTVAVSKEEVEKLSAEEIHQRILKNLEYDDFLYQRQNKIEISHPKLLDGIENVLYECPSCRTTFEMQAEGHKIWCKKCGYSAEMNEFGVFVSGKFSTVPEWYDFERQTVKNLVKNANYNVEIACTAEKQTKNKFKKIKGSATFVHNQDGIFVTFSNGEKLSFPSGRFFTLSANNDFIFLPTEDAVFRLSFSGTKGITTFVNLGVEEFAKELNKQKVKKDELCGKN